MIILKYIGNGSFIPGIPGHDLTEADVTATGMTVEDLVNTGLYGKIITHSKKEQPETANKAIKEKKYEDKSHA